jgi:hypothetical protein
VSATARHVTAVSTLAAAFAVARGPLHTVTFGQPVSNDDAILLLMARHVLKGELATTLWNQPYNGALDAYLLAPGLALGPHHLVYRLYELLCAVLLVLLAGLLARSLGGPRAGWAAALLAAVGTPYMSLMTATGPPPNFLMPLITGFPLLAALRALDRDAPPFRPTALLGVGLVCGLAVWNSSLAIPAFAGMAAGLLAAGLLPRPARFLVFGAGLVAGTSPLGIARLIGASGARVQTAASAVSAIRPQGDWGEGLKFLRAALDGLLGLQVPLVVDGPQRAALPVLLLGSLVVGLGTALVAGAFSRRALPLLGWAAALAGAFVLSRRTGPDELRYLYGLNAPLLALAGAGLGRAWAWRRSGAAALALAMVVPWAFGERLLATRWRDPAHAVRVWEVPRIEPPLVALRAAGLRSAYASLQFAGRITLESHGGVLASQAWNERIPGDPLRFRDEVDLDPSPAWVLSPTLSRGMPRAGGFRALVQSMGGTFEEEAAGDFVVFHGFRPPYDEARPVPVEQLALETMEGVPIGPAILDRDPRTVWTSTEGLGRGRGLVLRVRPARRLSTLVLAVDLERSPLAVPWAVSVNGHIVAEGPSRAGFQWVNGAPRAGKQALLAVPLGDRMTDDVRLVFQGPGPRLAIAEAFAYGPDEPIRPDTGRDPARRALEAARAGRWDEAVALYAEALKADPDRASLHAAWARARWRSAQRRWLDVESLDDGGPELVEVPQVRLSSSADGSGRRRLPSPGIPPRKCGGSSPRTSRGPCGTSPPRWRNPER